MKAKKRGTRSRSLTLSFTIRLTREVDESDTGKTLPGEEGANETGNTIGTNLSGES